jgi:hypothetical protein
MWLKKNLLYAKRFICCYQMHVQIKQTATKARIRPKPQKKLVEPLSIDATHQLSNASFTSTAAVAEVWGNFSFLVERLRGTYSREEIHDAMFFDAFDLSRLNEFVSRLRIQLTVDGVFLPPKVFLTLGFLIYFGLVKGEQTGVDVCVVDAYHQIMVDSVGSVTRQQFIALFFRYGMADISRIDRV